MAPKVGRTLCRRRSFETPVAAFELHGVVDCIPKSALCGHGLCHRVRGSFSCGAMPRREEILFGGGFSTVGMFSMVTCICLVTVWNMQVQGVMGASLLLHLVRFHRGIDHFCRIQGHVPGANFSMTTTALPVARRRQGHHCK